MNEFLLKRRRSMIVLISYHKQQKIIFSWLNTQDEKYRPRKRGDRDMHSERIWDYGNIPALVCHEENQKEKKEWGSFSLEIISLNNMSLTSAVSGAYPSALFEQRGDQLFTRLKMGLWGACLMLFLCSFSTRARYGSGRSILPTSGPSKNVSTSSSFLFLNVSAH